MVYSCSISKKQSQTGDALQYEGMHPASQINAVKNFINAKDKNTISAFEQMIVSANAALTMQHHALADFSVPGFYKDSATHRSNSLSIQKDGFAAYNCALAWRLTGEEKYRKKAVYFLDAWSTINKKYSQNDGSLVMAYSGTSFMMAAQLLKPSKKWETASRESFNQWLNNVYLHAANKIKKGHNNWGDWGCFGALLATSYLNDTAAFAENVQLLKKGIIDKISEDGHMPAETKRGGNSIWYTYFSLAPITASCWVVYTNTGENLFQLEQDGKSIKKALDYLLQYHENPGKWPWAKNPVTQVDNHRLGPVGVWPYNLFEAMHGIYQDKNFKKFADKEAPIIYPDHHYAWVFPSLMQPKIKGTNK
ncbi:alginate lyase family protein [Niabella ginsengisoli]|uniref:Alginate lyase family protein n=1 Tax=Niabella ginsengisoli TaxID=522298 RepID=A0ABS9SQW1_9BACT|nr:alginate lyase family protein [Niabella ginsengisoli]MCH5600765.1 alginate lyase family protein [Niabella ginsengisoli]